MGNSGLASKYDSAKDRFSGIELCGNSFPQAEHVSVHWLMFYLAGRVSRLLREAGDSSGFRIADLEYRQ